MWLPRTRNEAADFARFVGVTELALAALLFIGAMGYLLWTAWIMIAWGGRDAPGSVFMTLLGVLAVVAEFLYLRSRLRLYLFTRRRCLACGYDLRATPQRCPECGTVPTKPTT